MKAQMYSVFLNMQEFRVKKPNLLLFDNKFKYIVLCLF